MLRNLRSTGNIVLGVLVTLVVLGGVVFALGVLINAWHSVPELVTAGMVVVLGVVVIVGVIGDIVRNGWKSDLW